VDLDRAHSERAVINVNDRTEKGGRQASKRQHGDAGILRWISGAPVVSEATG
jgi:hypothetical protein